jgi:hypothetical protein
MGVAMPWIDNFFTVVSPEQFIQGVQAYWIVPAGMLVLYFYGRFRFNTPDYSITADGASRRGLLTPAPPIFTTSRSRFNRYARRYVLILEIAFLGFIFFASVLSDIGKVTRLGLPDMSSDSVQYRAVLALFFLTGFLSSFPGFKDLDAWILKKLHEAALIPDEVRLLAVQLFEAPYVPGTRAASAVRSMLISRDTIKVADGLATGGLESTVLKLLWLNFQPKSKTEKKHMWVKVKLERDINDVQTTLDQTRKELLAYFKDQEKAVTENVKDIDAYLADNAEGIGIAQLIERRHDLQEKCDALFYRMCIIEALWVFATRSAPEDIGEALSELGFKVDVQATRIMDWDAVTRITLVVLGIMLIFNALFAAFVSYFNLATVPALRPGRETVLRFAIIGTLSYLIVMFIVIKLKRYWRRDNDPHRHRPENTLAAIYCYLLCLPLFFAISLYIREGQVSIAPLLFAINQGVLAYFVATYVDRSLQNQDLSWRLAVWQGVVQGITTLGVMNLAPPAPGNTASALVQFEISLFFMFQSGIAGCLMGLLFQYFYRRTKAQPGRVLGDLTLNLKTSEVG